MAKIPERLKPNKRPADQDFAPTEKLFRRFKQEHYVGDQFSNMGFQFDTDSGPSVNREKYSVAQDILLSPIDEFEGWGVLYFQVGDLPDKFPPENPQYTFFPQHIPVESNYAHSEVWCDRLPRTNAYVRPSKGVRKLFRAFLSQRVKKETEASA